MTQKDQNKSGFIYRMIMVISTFIIVGMAGFFYKIDFSNIVGNLLIISILLISGIFAISLYEKRDSFLTGNTSVLKLFITYELFLIASVMYPLFPDSEWLFLPAFISIMLFSNEIIGVLLGTTLLVISLLLSQSTDIVTFVVFLAPGILGIILFSSIDEEFKVLYPLVISLGLQFLALCIKDILLSEREFDFFLLLMPFVNILISSAIIIFSLKMFSFTLFNKNDRCLDIIDPEFELLVNLRNESKEDYDHAIYTALLCSKMAGWIGLDQNLTKACGYYHKIGLLAKSISWEDINELLVQYDFPKNVVSLLKEYNDSKESIKSKEMVVVLLADTVISSIRYLFMKDKEAVIDYDKLINAIIDKKINSGIISESKISYEEISIIRKKLVDENTFYDFLR